MWRAELVLLPHGPTWTKPGRLPSAADEALHGRHPPPPRPPLPATRRNCPKPGPSSKPAATGAAKKSWKTPRRRPALGRAVDGHDQPVGGAPAARPCGTSATSRPGNPWASRQIRRRSHNPRLENGSSSRSSSSIRGRSMPWCRRPCCGGWVSAQSRDVYAGRRQSSRSIGFAIFEIDGRRRRVEGHLRRAGRRQPIGRGHAGGTGPDARSASA